jgi:3-isopropylmalate/(R)-2-methylmalate dehydratase small subunit
MIIIRGKGLKIGDNINTDVIIAGKYLNITEPQVLALHVMEDFDPEFFKKIYDKNILVAGRNFGCGSSREQAVICLKYAGVKAIIAQSFSRIFYRNAINQGLFVIESTEAVAKIETGDELLIYVNDCMIEDKTKNFKFMFHALPDFLNKILMAGGLISWLNKKIK